MVSFSDVSELSCSFVKTVSALSTVVDVLDAAPKRPPSIYVDLEGQKLSRHGTISILQLHVASTKHTYLVDVFTLGEESFTTCGRLAPHRTLKGILEDLNVPKVFFDVRNDSDALYSHYKVQLKGVQDVQLMEIAARTYHRQYVNGLGNCISRDLGLTGQERRQWQSCKDEGQRLFSPDCGGSYAVFDARPLADEILQYCVQDVLFLPRLYHRYNGRLSPTWRERVKHMSGERVAESCSAQYDPSGEHKRKAPVAWTTLSD